MDKQLIDKFSELKSIENFEKFFNSDRITFTSSVPDSVLSLLILTKLPHKKQIVIFLPNRIKVDETKVELSELGFEEDLVIISEFSSESIQEKITALSKKERFILVSTYQLLKLLYLRKKIFRKTLHLSRLAVKFRMMS